MNLRKTYNTSLMQTVKTITLLCIESAWTMLTSITAFAFSAVGKFPEWGACVSAQHAEQPLWVTVWSVTVGHLTALQSKPHLLWMESKAQALAALWPPSCCACLWTNRTDGWKIGGVGLSWNTSSCNVTEKLTGFCCRSQELSPLPQSWQNLTSSAAYT